MMFFFKIVEAVRSPENNALVMPTVVTSCPVR
jgi:hypothetical protein